MRAHRRLLAVLSALAVTATVVQAVTGVQELALYLTPVLLIAGFLLAGRYVGEDAIVRRWISGRVPSRAVRPRRRLPLPAAPVLRSRAATAGLWLRGPPVAA